MAEASPSPLRPATVLYAVEGERLEVYPSPSDAAPHDPRPDGAATLPHVAPPHVAPPPTPHPVSARLTSRLPPRPHWVSEESVAARVAGFDDIGRITALEVDGALHMLVAVRTEGDVSTCTFRRWPDEELPRAVVRYPADELARLEREARARRDRSERTWWMRLLLKPIVGALPRDLQHAIADRLAIDLAGASWWNTMLLAAVALNGVVFAFVIAPFVAVYGVDLGTNAMMGPILYLVFESAGRLLFLWRASFTESTDDDELGLLLLEGVWAAGRWALGGGARHGAKR